MRLDDLLKRPDLDVATPARPDVRRRPDVVVGGLPTVSLLPREFHAAARERSVRRALAAAVVVAVVVSGGAAAIASTVAGSAQSRLEQETATSQSLAAQLGKFNDVQALLSGISLGDAAVKVGASTEIDWQAQIGAIEQYMPAGYTVTTIMTESATPVADYLQGTSPLEKTRAATVTLTARTSDITQLPYWLRKIRSIPAYADASSNVSHDDSSGYAVQLVVHLAPSALVHSTSTGKAATP